MQKLPKAELVFYFVGLPAACRECKCTKFPQGILIRPPLKWFLHQHSAHLHLPTNRHTFLQSKTLKWAIYYSLYPPHEFSNLQPTLSSKNINYFILHRLPLNCSYTDIPNMFFHRRSPLSPLQISPSFFPSDISHFSLPQTSLTLSSTDIPHLILYKHPQLYPP